MYPSLQINQSMSLYIPWVSTEITKEQIAHVFESNLFGEVSRIDLVSKTDYKEHYYNAAYIHFKEWQNTVMVHNFQEKLVNYKNGKATTPARVIYNDPYFWNVFISKSSLTKYINGTGQKKICIDLSDLYADAVCEKEILEKHKQEKVATNEMGAYLLSILRNNNSYCEQQSK